MELFARFMVYAQQCVVQPLGYPDCNALWGGVFLVAICFFGILAIKLIYRSFGNWRDEQRAVEEIITGRRVASPQAREQHKLPVL